MLLRFCPQCGARLQPTFKFCPSCGEKLPVEPDEGGGSPPSGGEQQSHTSDHIAATSSALIGSPLRASPRTPAARRTLSGGRTSLSLLKRRASGSEGMEVDSSPAPSLSSLPQTPPKRQRTQKQASPKMESPKATPTSSTQSPPSVKGRKGARPAALEPLQEGAELLDQTGKRWMLVKLLRQCDGEVTYGARPANAVSSCSDWKHILRLGAKQGPMFTEQNFLQRAAKPASVEKWVKHQKMDFLGIPSCVGFGLHDTYRFLVFPDMGQTLQSILDEVGGSLREAAVLQLSCRILDVLEFVHENEYVHADICAENIYVSTNTHTQVFLAGFGRAFRFSPGGRHVDYKESSRTLHHGNHDFISLDVHKGAAPSRRSDLQSLGYCLLSWLTGSLPWSSTHPPTTMTKEKERYLTDVPGLLSCCFGKRTVFGVLQLYLSQVMALDYTDKPNYTQLRAELTEELEKMGGTLQEPLYV
ncbi:serine/threonine-protein kinase VRK3 isoform X1 [Denticeps clupeoides]|uniref:serine/threonine-protein kinase VRK3 isoform X1 n=1 Tax=Denticeps clupeoides TaxID=299321 RepID=UPI0010A38F5B|nr:inactive serine/threonine-protein kinase VRK3-like isoform X1 [Denticeps clupeoides]